MSIIKSFSVGEGDMYYIDHNSDSFSIIDCCIPDSQEDRILSELRQKCKTKSITRFISTHPDEDHLCGLQLLNAQIDIPNFYCVDNRAIKAEETVDFKYYCSLRNSQKAYFVYSGCSRKWLNRSDSQHGCAGINFLWPNTNNPFFKAALSSVAEGRGFNNISPFFTYSVNNNITALWMGDIEHDFLEQIKDDVEWPKIDVLFAPHHGRQSGKVSADVLRKLNPYIVIIGEAPSQYLNYYSGFNTITQNSAGDITLSCSGDKVHIYISDPNYRYDTSFLTHERDNCPSLGFYLGSFVPKNAVNRW